MVFSQNLCLRGLPRRAPGGGNVKDAKNILIGMLVFFSGGVKGWTG